MAFRLEDRAQVRFQVLVAPCPAHVHHHTLPQYLAKKVECGRQSLPHLARLHPGRLREMNLHHALDLPGGPAPGGATRLLRALTDGPLGRALPGLLAAWPTAAGQRPRAATLYWPPHEPGGAGGVPSKACVSDRMMPEWRNRLPKGHVCRRMAVRLTLLPIARHPANDQRHND